MLKDAYNEICRRIAEKGMGTLSSLGLVQARLVMLDGIDVALSMTE